MDENIKDVMERIKNLGEYEVEYRLPPDFIFNGVVPFDMSICSEVAHVKVIAISLEDAVKKVENYFEGNNYED